MDLLFLETLIFKLPALSAFRYRATSRTLFDAAAAACEHVGLELIDYDSMVFCPGDPATVILYSKAWRQRTERSPQRYA